METINRKNRTSEIALLISASSIFAAIGVISFIFHISPDRISEILTDFEEHHYFIISYSSLLLGLITFKRYLNTIEKNNKSYNTSSPILLKNTQHSVAQLETKINYNEFTVIDKSLINNSNFKPGVDVLTTKELKEKRKSDINKCLILGNLFKHKVTIYFTDETGNKKTTTTIWHADEVNIGIKGGVTIPVKNIYKISY